jgi:hypothetical protein
LETIETSFHQDLNGDGVIGVPGAPTSPAVAAAQPVSIATGPAHDAFVFSPSLGAAGIANAGNTDPLELGQFSSAATSGELAAFFGDPHPGPSLPPPQSANFGGDTATNPGNHDGAAVMNFHLTDPHVGHFIIG